jgi:outer membrane protein, multidrug efflux system
VSPFGRTRAVVGIAGAAALLLGACALKPIPLTNEEQAAISASDRTEMFGNQARLTKPLTLQEAFRRALAYNLDARVKVMEEALSQNDLDLSRYDLLPKLYTNDIYAGRNNQNASSSQSVINGTQTVPPSRSTDIDDLSAQLTLSWNILDFGVSYVNARQQANRVLVAEEERRKVVTNLLGDVRRDYWRAVAAQRLQGRIEQAMREAQNALPAARKVETEGLQSPVDSLRYQKALLELINQLEAMNHLLNTAKTELASLIGLPPDLPYTLAVPSEHELVIRSVPMSVRKMEETALIFNPEVREQSYQTRISADEARKALLQMLPGFTISLNPNYDSNSFLVHHGWVTGSAQLAGYLSNLLTAPVRIRRAGEMDELSARRRQAISMATLAKLYIAYQQYLSDAAEYRLAADMADVDGRLYQQISNRTATDVQGDLERVSAQVSSVYSALRQYQSYAETQAALGRIYAALGIDPGPGPVEQLDLAGVERDVTHALAQYKANPLEAAPPLDKTASNDDAATAPRRSYSPAALWLADAFHRMAKQPDAAQSAAAIDDPAPAAEQLSAPATVADRGSIGAN